MIDRNSIIARYGKYSDEVIDYIININNLIKDQDNNDAYYYCIYDLLSTQLFLYFSAKNELLENTKLTTTDSYARTAKSPLVGLLNRCHANILDIMQKLSLGKMEQAKLKRLNKNDGDGDGDESAKQIINKLIND